MGDHMAFGAAWLLAADSPTNPGLGQTLLSAAGPHDVLHMCRITRCFTSTIRTSYYKLIGLTRKPLQAQTTLIAIAQTVYGILRMVCSVSITKLA